ncbi:MAG: Ig-like domain-containing protein [Candidatus Thermoplasmatota archaeon]|nr:Ig-like domain-containing protein [Candidatus Thermoplasmatota archaeon]
MTSKQVKKFGTMMVLLMLTLTSFMAMANGRDDKGTKASYPYAATVHLKLQYENTDPASGFTVKLLHRYKTAIDTKIFSTDIDGECAFKVEVWDWGPCRLWAHDMAETYWWTIDLFVEPNGNYTIGGTVGPTLPLDNRISGVVKDSDTGLPIMGADIEFGGYDDQGRSFSDNLNTGLDGAYSFMFPDADEAYSLQVDHPSYNGYSAEVYLVPWKEEYQLDIWMVKTHVLENILNVKALNKTTGEELALKYVSFNGLSSLADHSDSYGYSYTPNSGTGYFELPIDMGEYQLRMETKDDPELNVSIEMNNYVIINDTDIYHNAYFPVPLEWRDVHVHIENETVPLYYAYVNYYLDLDGMYIRGSSHTDTMGDANVRIPAWTDVEMEMWDYDHSRVLQEITGGPASSEVNLSILLEYEARYTPPTGQVSLLVKDEVSGLPMPMVSANGYYYDYDRSYYSYLNGVTGPDGYFNGTADVGFYTTVNLESSLGVTTLYNVTITESETTYLTGTITRRPFPPSPFELRFRLVDQEGASVPFQPVTISGDYPSNAEYEPMSGPDGSIALLVAPGDYTVFMDTGYECIRGWRSTWTMEELGVSVRSNTTLPDITVYPTKPLMSIEGMVRDAVTGNIIPQQEVSASSFHVTAEPPTRQMPYVMGYWEQVHGQEEDRIYYFYERYSGSTYEGFYRTWGGTSVNIHASREGYYYYDVDLDLSTRAPFIHDVLMEPIPEYTTHVSGTLVDEDGSPLDGFVAILDVPHDHFIVDEMEVDASGEFSLECYPGQLRVLFGNETLWDYIDIEVPSGGIEGLKLVLAPKTFINGTVKDWKGDPVSDITVTLEDRYDTPLMAVGWTTTGADGLFSFEVGRGTYGLFIDETEIYQGYSSEPIVTLGWDPLSMDIVLFNRTEGTLFGKVTGSGGPLTGGIPGARIYFQSPTIGDIDPVFDTDMNGNYSLTLPYASDWTMKIEPPLEYAGIEGIRTGYLENTVGNITISQFIQEMNVILPYIEVHDVELVNVSEWGPVGEDVPLNMAIWVQFTHPMNRSSVSSNIIFDPPVTVTGHEWNTEGDRVYIQHDDLLPDTDYKVTVDGSVVSIEGLPLWAPEGFSWTFTTGSDVIVWTLDSKDVEVLSDRSVNVEARGGEGQVVYFVIVGFDSFLLEEEEPGVYNGGVNGSLLEWDTTYEYYFSNSLDGPEMAPNLRGTFKTPIESIEPDDDDDDVIVDDDDGSWKAIRTAGLVCCLLLFIVLIVILIVFIAMRRKDKGPIEE